MKYITLLAILIFSFNVSAKMAVPDSQSVENSIVSQEQLKQKVQEAKSAVLNFWNKAKQYTQEKVSEFTGEPIRPNTKVSEIINRTEEEEQQIKEAQKTRKQIQNIAKDLPEYNTTTQKEMGSSIEKALDSAKSAEALKVLDQGVKADPNLKKDKAGVPVADLYEEKQEKSKDGKTKTVKVKVKDLPKLNIGREPKLSPSSFQISEIKTMEAIYKTAKKLPEPKKVDSSKITHWTNKKIDFIEDHIDVKREQIGLDQIVSFATIEKALPNYIDDKKVEEKQYVEFDRNHLKMLTALMIYAKGETCHVVAGLFDDLSTVKEYSQQANYLLGICAHEMGFYSESVSRLIKVIQKEDPIITPKAIEVVVSHLPAEYEERVAKALLNLKNRELIPQKALDNAHYVIAKGMSTDRAFSYAKTYAQKVSKASKHYPRAQFILSVAEYASNDLKGSIGTLRSLRKHMANNKVFDKELESLISINLGRMLFQMGKYKDSTVEYLKVSKSSPFWVEGLTEQAWSQLLMDDPSGAIGNMYSLHSPYFKSVYKPESYVVRTIGYLNICQYGDAYQTLNLMEQLYEPWYKDVKSYVDKTTKLTSYYKTLSDYLRGKSSNNVDGLPYQVIREIARKRNFLNHQEAINQKVDEAEQYSFIERLISKDINSLIWRQKQAKKRAKQYEYRIEKAKKDKSLAKNLNTYIAKRNFENHLTDVLGYQIAVYKAGRKSFRSMKKAGIARLEKEKAQFRVAAGRALKNNLNDIKQTLAKLIDNNELLRYEVLANSGENIRFRLAGGDTAKTEKRLPSSYKPKKTLSWSVTGEYWEDEIGNYRSQLKNNCPQTDKGVPLQIKNTRAN